MQTSPWPRRAFALGIGLLATATLAVIGSAIAWNAGFLHDDAFITLRYAQNWMAGNGIAWNPGDRVEGYTNFLQLLLARGLGALGVDLIAALRVIGCASWLGTVAAVALAALRGGEGRSERWGFGALVPVAATAAFIPGIAWVFGGLEAPLVGLALTVGGLALHDTLSTDDAQGRVLALAGVAFAAALLTRLDTGIFVALAAVFGLASSSREARLRRIVAFGGPLLVIVAPWLVWKLAYYGHVLPNTWWVKGSDPTDWRFAAGLRYVGTFLLVPPFPLLWAALGTLRALAARRLTLADAYLASAITAHLGWVVYVGGDQMPAWRLAVPVVPLSCWLAFRLWWPDLRRLRGYGAGGLLAVTAVGIALQLVWPAVAGPQRNATAFVGAAVAEHMRESWRPGALVALNTAGSTPYHAPGFRYLDMLGLNDAHIARRPLAGIRTPGQRLPGHAKGDGTYVLDQAPDYIILGPASGVPATHPWFLSDLEVSEDPRFARDYVQRRSRIDVRGRAGFEDHEETRAGAVVFTWYERRR